MTDLNETIKHHSLREELETSSKLVSLGLGELQNLDQANDFYFLPFQLLSQGFERAMKGHICLGHLEKHGNYPNFKYLKNLGHDLLKLKDEIINEYFINEYFDEDHPTLKNDLKFLKSDVELGELLSILSEFGKMARYYNFDVITDSTKTPINAEELWTEFENKIPFSNDDAVDKLMNWDINNEVHGEIARYIIIIFEQFMASLGRQFLFGGLGAKGKQFSNSLFDFAMLYEKDLGQKDYRKNTTRFKQKPKKVHKRTFLDEVRRKSDSNYKSKQIRKEDFDGEWPFYAESVIVERRHKHWCIITIDGHDYALNGAAQGKYKLENPHDAGMAIVGKSIGDFIKIALEL